MSTDAQQLGNATPPAKVNPIVAVDFDGTCVTHEWLEKVE